MLRAICCAGLLALLPGCGQEFYADVKVDRVCLTRLQEPVPGVPLEADEVEWQGVFDLGSTLADDAFSGTIELLEFGVDAGATDLSGITLVRVSVLDEQGEATAVVDYSPAQPVSTPTPSFRAAVASDLNLFPYLQAETLRFAVLLRGAPPTRDWAADFDLCLSADVRVTAAGL